MAVALQDQFEYRFNFVSNILFSLIPFFTNLLIWIAISKYSKNTFNLSIKEIISYYFIILILENVLGGGLLWNIANDIKSGDLNKYIIKPINYMLYQFFSNIPVRIVYALISIIPITVVGFILREYLVITLNIKIVLCFLTSVVIGFIINFLIGFILSEISFYFAEITSLFGAVNILSAVVSGRVFPLSIVPKSIYNILRITPFQYSAYFPSLILLNKLSEKEIFSGLLIGLLWVSGLYFLANRLWKVGLKKYSAIGG